MMILALDSTGTDCSAALWQDDRILAQQSVLGDRQQAEILVPMIERILVDVGIKRVDRIAVTIGPGSFTGIRIGLATARGLAIGWGCPCIGIDNFRLFGEKTSRDNPEQPIAVVIDSRRAELFAQAWYQGQPIDDPVMASADLLPALLGQRFPASGHWHLVGNGAGQGQPYWPAGQCTFGADTPDLAELAKLASQSSPDAATARPFYLRPPDVTMAKSVLA